MSHETTIEEIYLPLLPEAPKNMFGPVDAVVEFSLIYQPEEVVEAAGAPAIVTHEGFDFEIERIFILDADGEPIDLTYSKSPAAEALWLMAEKHIEDEIAYGNVEPN